MRTILFNATLLIIVLFVFGCETGINLVENNSSRYKIVIPSNANDIEKYAAEELKRYLFEISGTELKIKEDSDTKSEAEIIIGNSSRIKELGIAFDSNELEEDGYIIKTVDDHLIILGGRKKGILYGVYTLLDNYLGVKMLSPSVTYVPTKSKIKIPGIDLKEIPFIKYRELHIPSARSSQKFCDWHKLHHPSVRAKEYGSFVHTFERLIPSDIYFEDHPEYFSEINGKRIPNQQLCLSNNELYAVLLSNLKKKMNENPDAKVWDVSQNDNFGSCMCYSCAKADSIYGSPSGIMIEFVNKIARQFPDKTISTLAYQYTRKAPVGIKPESNVMVVLCTIECDRSKPIAVNEGDLFNRDIKEWSALTDNIKIWDYVVQFASYANPFPNFHVLKPNINLFVDNGVRSLFEQGSGDSYSDMHELKAYVLAKLMWNPDVDVQGVIDEFVSGYYGNASEYISRYLYLRQKSVQNSDEPLIIYGYPRTGINSYLTPELLNEYSSLFDKAEEAVANNRGILNRVKFARVPLEYAILEIAKLNLNSEYRIFFPNEEKVSINSNMKDRLERFVLNANNAGIERLHERGATPDEYFEQMQKYFSEGMIIHEAYQKEIKILSDIHPNYSANGSNTLTDGITGEANYYFNWLGFEANDFEAIIDLADVKNINSIRTNYLQEVKSWIWLPKSVEYFVSDDEQNFKKIGEVINEIDETRRGIFTEQFKLDVDNIKARYIKVKTNSLINCPVWHIGYNGGKGKAFIFVDEIIVE